MSLKEQITELDRLKVVYKGKFDKIDKENKKLI
jgi:hypothetical protein